LIATARHVQGGAKFVQGIWAVEAFHKLEALALGLAKISNVF
jgi:hypothetical protein